MVLRFFIIIFEPITNPSMSVAFNTAKASFGVSAIGLPNRFRDVFRRKGKPVFFLNEVNKCFNSLTFPSTV